MKAISDNYGVISRCHCTNPDLPEHCRNCMCRGFVAACLACSATGQTTEPVAGVNTGTMKATCPACGGTGKFAVKKPADWDAEHAEPVEQSKVEEDEDEDFNALVAGAKESIPSEEMDRIASKFSAAPEVDVIAIGLSQGFTPESTVGEVFGGVVTVIAPNLSEPATDGEMEAATDPIRPKSVHWKTWEKLTKEERIAAVEAAKAETPELASV